MLLVEFPDLEFAFRFSSLHLSASAIQKIEKEVAFQSFGWKLWDEDQEKMVTFAAA